MLLCVRSPGYRRRHHGKRKIEKVTGPGSRTRRLENGENEAFLLSTDPPVSAPGTSFRRREFSAFSLRDRSRGGVVPAVAPAEWFASTAGSSGNKIAASRANFDVVHELNPSTIHFNFSFFCIIFLDRNPFQGLALRLNYLSPFN